ncbi:hypothetical protein N7528_005053 [Penicillium herquei]|nr:hypothetical protein N7528_005053 [Penicillium herquei]
MPGDPVFLKNVPRFQWYREEGMAGRLQLPPYERTVSEDQFQSATDCFPTLNADRSYLQPDGEIIVYSGEVFCRVPHCEKNVVPVSSTPNLRNHILNVHRERCKPRRAGALTHEEKAQSIVWFNSLSSSADEDVNANDNSGANASASAGANANVEEGRNVSW